MTTGSAGMAAAGKGGGMGFAAAAFRGTGPPNTGAGAAVFFTAATCKRCWRFFGAVFISGSKDGVRFQCGPKRHNEGAWNRQAGRARGPLGVEFFRSVVQGGWARGNPKLTRGSTTPATTEGIERLEREVNE